MKSNQESYFASKCMSENRYRVAYGTKSMKHLLFSSMLLVMVGCTTKTEPVTEDFRKDRVVNDTVAMFAGQEAVQGPITIGEAIARSLSYNLDHRLKRMESAVAQKKYDFDRLDVLPDLIASAGYSRRNNEPGARSIDLETGEESLPPSSSQERTVETSDLIFTWNILDFGLSYYIAKQSSDEVLIAEERRRKTVQNITQDVIDAFWKAWMAQSIEPKVDALLAEMRAALDESKELVAKGVQNPSIALNVQEGLLNNINSLIEIREQVSLSKTRLGALINLAPGEDYKVAAPVSLEVPAVFAQDIDSLTQIALINRPELREEDYRKRISQVEVKKTFLKLFPNLNFTAGFFRDENEFLVNNSFNQIGWNISWNLLQLFEVNAEKHFNEAQVSLADVRRQALSMAVMTQVYLSISRYELARSRYSAASELYEIRNNVARNNQVQGSRASGVEELSARALSISSELRRNLAFAETQAAFARVINSVGLDPVPDYTQSSDLKSLSMTFNQRWASMIKGVLVSY